MDLLCFAVDQPQSLGERKLSGGFVDDQKPQQQTLQESTLARQTQLRPDGHLQGTPALLSTRAL